MDYVRALCFHRIFALLLVAVLAAGGRPADAQRSDYEDVIERTLKARPGQTLHLNADLGAVEVRGGGGDVVRVRVVKGVDASDRSQAKALLERYRVDIRDTSGGVDVVGRYDRNTRLRRNGIRVRYEITVPDRYHLDLSTSGGSMRVEGVDGKVRLVTAGGSIDVGDVGGPVEARTSGGSVTVRRVGDHVRVNTSGGAVRIEGVQGPVDATMSGGSIQVTDARGDVKAHTSGGSIRLSRIAGSVDGQTSGGGIEAEIVGPVERPVTLEASGGSVGLRLDPSVRAELDARAAGGRVRVDLPVTVQGEMKRDRLEGTLNGGGPPIRLRSSGGSVSVRPR